MPTGPGAGLVVSHPHFALRLLEELLNTDALAGDFRQRFQRDSFLGIRDPAAENMRMIDFPLEHQPDGRPGFFVPPSPDANPRVFIDNRSFGSFAKLERSP